MTHSRHCITTSAVVLLAAIFAGAQDPTPLVFEVQAPVAQAQSPGPPSAVFRQSLADAWWTGPLLANSPSTLPRGHFLVEPYLYDVMGANAHGIGSRAYIEYGLFDRLTVGVIPILDYNIVSGSPSSSGIRFGDLTPLAQYRLTRFNEHSWVPATAIMVQETFPTGRFDRLGDRLNNGTGSGAYATMIALNSQKYFWLPNGRILRMRFDVSETLSRSVNVKDTSVYGTSNGFRGHADPASSLFVDAAWEYSKTRNWVLALDIIYHNSGNTTVSGHNISDPNAQVRSDSGSSAGFGFAPAVEYNWTANLGVIFGVRMIAHGRNTATTVTPAIAINFVR